MAQTVMLTTKCSSGCTHCPFSNPMLEPLFLAPTIVQKILRQSSGKLIVLSGGEPFQHPEIAEILKNLSEQSTPFRIATGGFVDLTPWISQLKWLTHPYGMLQGISMGTDVLSSRIHHSKWVPIWKNNIRLLSEATIPYSLTFSIEIDLEWTHLDVWNWVNLFDSMPAFIYLRYSEERLIQEWTRKVENSFKCIPIIRDNISI